MKCDFCLKEAIYDAKTKHGPWAWLCESCFKNNAIGLGLGKGHKIEKYNQLKMKGEKDAN